jgi:hypothetical protein
LRADKYEQKLKTIAQAVYQLQKIKHYQQLEREKNLELEAQIVQVESFRK